MAIWESLKIAINSAIKKNDNQEITGQVLNSALLSIINSIGLNASYTGLVKPNMSIAQPEGPVFYIATTPGVYSNCGGFTVDKGEIAILKWTDKGWSKDTLFARNYLQELSYIDLNEPEIGSGITKIVLTDWANARVFAPRTLLSQIIEDATGEPVSFKTINSQEILGKGNIDIKAGTSISGKLNLADLNAVKDAQDGLGENDVRFFVITDSEGKIPSTQKCYDVPSDVVRQMSLKTGNSIVDLALNSVEVEPIGVSVGDLVALTKVSVKLSDLAEAVGVSISLGGSMLIYQYKILHTSGAREENYEEGCTKGVYGLLSPWDKQLIDGSAKPTRYGYGHNPDDMLQSGVLAYTSATIDGVTANWTIFVDCSASPDGSGFYHLTQTAVCRDAGNLGEVYMRLGYYQKGGAATFTPWQHTTDSGFSGDYNDLTNKPAIPTKVSELNNDSGYVTGDELATAIADGSITTEKIAAGAVTSEKIAPKSVTADQLSFATVEPLEVGTAGDSTLAILVKSGTGKTLLVPSALSLLMDENGDVVTFKTINGQPILGSGNIDIEGGGGYEPPIGGIPRADLSDDVQASLGKADTALQEAFAENLLLNARFSNNAEKWDGSGYQVINDIHGRGVSGVRLDEGHIEQYVDVEEGYYTLSFWHTGLYGENYVAVTGDCVDFESDLGEVGGSGDYILPNHDTPKKHTIRFYANEGTLPISFEATGEMSISEVKLEKSKKASDFSLNALDIADKYTVPTKDEVATAIANAITNTLNTEV